MTAHPTQPQAELERFARRLIRRSYPRRFVEARGDELLGTLLDLSDPDAERLDRRLVLDTLIGGARFRLRDRPPLLRWLAYLLGKRLPDRWRLWVRDDVLGRSWPARRMLPGLAVSSLAYLGYQLYLAASGGHPVPLHPVDLPITVLVWGGYAATGLIGRRKARRKILEPYGFTEDGEPIPDYSSSPWWADWPGAAA